VRVPHFVATILAVALIACSGPEQPDSGLDPESTVIETPEHSEASPSGESPTPKGPENTLIETPKYTGVIISENGASEFRYLFDEVSTGFWEPSPADVSRAEECIRQFLDALHEDPTLSAYPKEDATFIRENLEEYRRQCLGIDVDGEKRIWVNSFFSADSFPKWPHVPVDVDGGGNHYWQIEYDLLRDECVNFRVHGKS
jgi:hypothetical protein